MKIKPLGKNLVVKFDVDSEKTKGGLWIPEHSRSEKKVGTIIRIGSKVKTLKEGERILLYSYPSHCGDKIEYEGETYYLVLESDIVAKVYE